MALDDLICIALTILLGEEGVFWESYETDPGWWEVRLYTKRN